MSHCMYSSSEQKYWFEKCKSGNANLSKVDSIKNTIEALLKKYKIWEYKDEDNIQSKEGAFLKITGEGNYAEAGWWWSFEEYMGDTYAGGGETEGVWALVDLNLYRYPRQPEYHSWRLRIIDPIENFDDYDNQNMHFFWSKVTVGLEYGSQYEFGKDPDEYVEKDSDEYDFWADDEEIKENFLAPEFVHIFLQCFHLHENFGGGTQEENLILSEILRFLVHPNAQVCDLDIEVEYFEEFEELSISLEDNDGYDRKSFELQVPHRRLIELGIMKGENPN